MHDASRSYGLNLDRLLLDRTLNVREGLGGYYNADKKLLAIDLSRFASSSFKEVTSYSDKIRKLQSNRASLESQIQQTEARLGRSKASDKILKGDIKAMKSRLLDIDVKIQKYEKLIREGYEELPFTVADSFKEVKKQMQVRVWHEVGYHIDDRLWHISSVRAITSANIQKKCAEKNLPNGLANTKCVCNRSLKSVPVTHSKVYHP